MDSKSPSSTNPKIQSFLESLRQRSSIPRSEAQPSLPFSFENYQEKKRLEQQRKQEFFRSRVREFNEVYNHKQKQESLRIEQLQQELKKLARSVKRLDQEVDTAINQSPTKSVSIKYQESFYDHLRQMVQLLKKQVDNASTWMHLFNQRKKKQGYFWGQVQSSGTKFLLSEERGLATSIG